MNYDVFISYSTEDKIFVDALVHTLERNDIRCWYAPRDIPAGETWPAAITRAIQNSHIMLLLFSQASNNSQEVPKELALASTHRRLVIPVRIEDVLPSVEMQYHLINRHWLDVYGLNIDSAVQKVMDSLGQYRHLFGNGQEEEPAPGPGLRPPIRETVNRTSPAKWPKPALVGGLLGLAMLLLLILSWPQPETGLRDRSGPVAGELNQTPANLYSLALENIKTGDYQQAGRRLEAAAQLDYLPALQKLGDLYFSGQGFQQDYSTAAGWFEKAAELGWSEAQYSLGEMHLGGLHFPRDLNQALNWLNKAAAGRNPDALYRLGEIYEQGAGGMRPNLNTAFKWYYQAAQADDPGGQYKAGVMLCEGLGVSPDQEYGLRLLRRAARDRHEGAEEYLRARQALHFNEGEPQ